jgi:type IV secretion system protein TrbL
MERLRFRKTVVLIATFGLAFAGSGSIGTARAQADVCDSIPSIPMVPNPAKSGCKAVAGGAGAVPKLATDPRGAAADIVTAPIKAAGDEVMQGVTTWVAKGAGWLISQAGKLIGETTTPRITSPWFLKQYRTMGSLAAVFALPLLLICVLQGVLKRDGGVIVRGAFVQLPAAFLLAAVAVAMVQLLLQLTDQMSVAVATSAGDDAKAFFQDTGKALGSIASATGGTNSTPLFAVFLAALVAAAGAFCVWLELLVRSAAIYVAVLFLPFTFVAMIWPGSARWCRRLVELLIAIVFAKFVIVAIMALAAAALGHSRGDEAFQGVLAGAALMVLAAFSPFVLLKLVPFAESAATGIGSRRGPLGGAVVGPVASSMVMRRVMDSRSGSGGGGQLRAAPTTGGSAGSSGAAAGPAAAATVGVSAAQTAGRAAGSRAAGIGSYAELSGGGGQGASQASAGSTARPVVDGSPTPRPETVSSPPEAPAPRPRDGEGRIGDG